jgi:hypothetical protein
MVVKKRPKDDQNNICEVRHYEKISKLDRKIRITSKKYQENQSAQYRLLFACSQGFPDVG